MMHTVGSYEAKTHLPELLARVAKGDTVTITKRGVPVAQLVPPPANSTTNPQDVIDDLLSYSREQGRTLGTETVRGLIEAGRRY